MNKAPKYVASRTLKDPLDWQNSTVLQGDITEAVAGLKADDGGDLHVIGSTNLVQSLLEDDLVDEFRFIVDPLVVGGGKRTFGGDKTLRTMRLVDHQVTSKGSLIVTYAVSH